MKPFLTLASLLIAVLGCGWLLLPEAMLGRWGAHTDPVGLFLGRRYGAMLLGYAVVLWLGRAVGPSAGLVGFAIRRIGKGIDPRFGYAGAVLALWGCALGNYLVIRIQVASEYEVGFTRILTSLSPWQGAQILVATLGLHDVLFYGIALVAGDRLSIRSVTEADILRVAGP